MDLDRLIDEELIERARRDAAQADACLAVLYRRYYPKVAAWCLRISGDRQEAADLAQEVFLRVHDRLDGFRGDSRFSTWLYTVTRSIAI
ncbi:MAG TPA: RNA polymerase sigma factor, partial [Thermoanaerobaculia bacterium]